MRSIKIVLLKIIATTSLASLSILGLMSCTRTVVYQHEPVLASINIIDRSGMSETISQKDRLIEFENVDFLEHQPYEKVLRVYKRDCSGNIYAYMTTYHPNGQPKQYLEIVNQRANGSYVEWYSTGGQKIEAYVIGGEADLSIAAEKTWLFDGAAKAWTECGELESVFTYCSGELNGDALYYHSNGKIWKKVPFNQGKVDGVFQQFYEDGELMQVAHFQAGEREGESIRYWCKDKIAAKELYCRGKLFEGVYFDQCGGQISTVQKGNGEKPVFSKKGVAELYTFVNGEPKGLVKVYAENGQVIQEYSILNGLKEGVEFEYFPTPTSYSQKRPKLSIDWTKGNINGNVKTWYSNGTQESQREFSKNQKNGVSMAWYLDGSTMLIEEYEKDKLKKGEYFKKGQRLPVSLVKDGEGVASLYSSEGNLQHKVIYINGVPTLE